MSSTFTGFSDEDLMRIKSGEIAPDNPPQLNTSSFKKIDKITAKPKRYTKQYKLPVLQNQSSDDGFDNLNFEKCKLSLRSPSIPSNDKEISDEMHITKDLNLVDEEFSKDDSNDEVASDSGSNNTVQEFRKNSVDITPDIVRGVDNYTEDEIAAHRGKLEELQLRQKLMEEQNKKRKEMLAKALADRTKQTEEEVMRLEKIKKELQVLDGQFSQDVSVLRKKIDQACLSYADAEKHYLRIEKEFLQAKINLQKEKEKKELLTEHLCALITHNETRKAQKLETLMLELATDKKEVITNTNGIKTELTEHNTNLNDSAATDNDNTLIIDGVDQRSGKMVEFSAQS